MDRITGEEIVDNARTLAPEVARRADEIAAARRLPDDLVAALRDAGMFRMPMPREWGGPEMSPADQTRVVEILSTADPSTGWCVMIGSDAGYYASFLDEGPARELYPDLDAITAGWVVPAGRAQRVDGGYRVSGRWSFGSCSLHADVLVGGCLVFDGDELVMNGERPEALIAAAPASSFTILDTWYTTGLAGSGSNDYTTADLFVPQEHTFTLFEPARRPEPLYRFNGMFFSNTHGVPLGLARRAIDVVIELASQKILMPEMQPMKDAPRVRSAIAHAEAMLGAARAYTYTTLDEIWEQLCSGHPLTVRQRVDLALSRANAFQAARDVAQLMVDTAGSSAIYASSPLDRLLRDAVTMKQHIVAQERMMEIMGGLVLGTETGMPFL